MRVPRDAAALAAAVAGWKAQGARVAVVPTMGALHAGHLALVRHARVLADRVLATIFVNPTQFAAHEDLGRYPRDEAGDLAKLRAAGCDGAFAPPVAVIYPPGFSTAVAVRGPAEDLEGAHRPAMFGGVATVCARLFGLSRADLAVFGEKDWQQVMVVRRMAEDLALPVTIHTVPTVREADGLAFSSRNAYLDPAARRAAPALHAALREAATALAAGAAMPEAGRAVQARLAEAGFGPVDYVALRRESDFAAMERAEAPARLLAAAHLGRVRLIDNVAVPQAASSTRSTASP